MGLVSNRNPNYCFIDGQNLETGLKNQDLEVDYSLLYNYLVGKYFIKKVFYCIKYSNYRQEFYRDLERIGYTLVFSSGMGNSRIDGSHKVNVDADLIVTALEKYFVVEKFGCILISGDGDFVPLIRFFERQEEFVKIISTDRNSTSKMLNFDRYTKIKRNLTFIIPELVYLTQKISPPRGEWRD